jgi:Holliday junction DNA helicase RuvA
MIGFLKGRLLHKQPPHLSIDVSGVGYEVEATMGTFYQLPAIGEEVQIFTHLVVREDAQLLFGFSSEEERKMFRTLIKVNGVGAKMALTILSGIETDEFSRCIVDSNADRLVKLPGIGKKTAERLIVEMRDRLKDWELADTTEKSQNLTIKSGQSQIDEAVSALISLGYKPQEASRFVHAVSRDEMDSETIIREALKASVR